MFNMKTTSVLMAKIIFVMVIISWSSMTTTTAYRIFAVEPIPGRSHWNVMSAVLESLLGAGHEVVCATLHAPTDILAGHPNYTHVNTSKSSGTRAWKLNFTDLMNRFESKNAMLRYFVDRERKFCTTFYQMSEIRDIVSGNRRFDVIVIESLFSECLTLLPSRLNLPTVYVVSCPPINCIAIPTTGSPEHPSYMGAVLTADPIPKTFVQRLTSVTDYVQNNMVRWYRDAEVRTEFQWPKPRNTMLFINTHHSIEPARPIGPNVHGIGGIHLKPVKSLPPDFTDILNRNEKFGVIVFSFGSIVPTNSIPEHILNTFKFVFSQLPQTVVWKYESDHMADKPDNVVLCKWLPQRDMLHHPNVKLFISHGGLSGLYEVVDAGVPVLGMPLFYDQPRNIQRLVDLGMALSLDINTVSKFTLASAVRRLLENQSFAVNAKLVSSRFRDRPVSPAKSVVYWTEYLIEHGDEAHVRPLSADATWASHFMLDLCVTITVICLPAMYYITRIVLYNIDVLTNCFYVLK